MLSSIYQAKEEEATEKGKEIAACLRPRYRTFFLMSSLLLPCQTNSWIASTKSRNDSKIILTTGNMSKSIFWRGDYC